VRFFQDAKRPEQAPRTVEPPWSTLVLVCEKCKGARKGPDAREVRKGVRSLLGKPKHLRVVEVSCLDICPDDAVTVCIGHAGSRSFEVVTVDSHEALERLADSLRPSSDG
jgi:hypothetical protein